jgi:hypothetical protein
MIQRLCVLALFVTALSLPGASQPGRGQSSQRYVSWVAGVLTRMQTIRPGMTRDALLTVFTIEGGLSTRLHRTFVSRDCPYFKVDVEFQAVGLPDRNTNGRATPVEGGRDIIVKISRPYVQPPVAD